MMMGYSRNFGPLSTNCKCFAQRGLNSTGSLYNVLDMGLLVVPLLSTWSSVQVSNANLSQLCLDLIVNLPVPFTIGGEYPSLSGSLTPGASPAFGATVTTSITTMGASTGYVTPQTLPYAYLDATAAYQAVGVPSSANLSVANDDIFSRLGGDSLYSSQ